MENNEAERLAALYKDDPRGLIGVLSGQLSVLKTQAQMLLGLCGLCITVTGFSGHNMVRAGIVNAVIMAIGIGLIAVSVVVTIRTMIGIRWVTQDLSDSVVAMATKVIERRDRQQRAVSAAGVLAAVGLSFYVVSVVVAAVVHSNWGPP